MVTSACEAGILDTEISAALMAFLSARKVQLPNTKIVSYYL